MDDTSEDDASEADEVDWGLLVDCSALLYGRGTQGTSRMLSLEKIGGFESSTCSK